MPTSSEIGALAPKAVTEFEAALRVYTADLTTNFASLMNAQPEDQLKAPVGALVKAAGSVLGIAVASRTEVQFDDVRGRPDLGVESGGLTIGGIELKKPGHGARPDDFPDARSREQWERFKAIPNLIYTDGCEWALYRSGELVGGPYLLSFDPTNAAQDAPTPTDASALLGVLSDFLGWEPIVPSTPHALATMLAPVARMLRREVRADVGIGGPLATLFNDWKATLFPDADEEDFSDGYAQTFTYALLLARLEGAQTPLDAATAARELREDHALLSQVLLVLGQEDARDAIGWPVGLLERIIGAVDAARLTKGRDPWLYFYEDFLAAYDPAQRNNRGVYFTPYEVVACQVRMVHHLLVEQLDRPDGFGDSSVVVLDPATGTGTYLLTVVAHAAKAVEHKGAGIVAEVATQLAENLNAFEILVGPYAVTHLRLSRALVDLGATVRSVGVNVFLTDALAAPKTEGFAKAAPLFQQRLAAEQERASKVKSEETSVTVVLGNPPYDRDTSGKSDGARRKGGMVRYASADDADYGLIKDFRDPLPTEVRAQHGLNLFNDYVYFWRWAIWKVCEQHADPGIVSFITPSSFLTGPAYAGMREMMRREFDELWFLDLGGEGRGTRKDDNVFSGVLTPVVITTALRRPQPEGYDRAGTPAAAHYQQFTGTQAEKYARLDALMDLSPDTAWRDAPLGWQDSFVPSGVGAFSDWPDLADLLPWSSRGIQFSRSWPVSEDKALCQQRWDKVVAAAGTPEQEALLNSSRDADVTKSYPSFLNPAKRLSRLDSLSAGSAPDGIERISFRSFDRQWAVADRRVIDMPRPSLWHVRSPRQVYFTTVGKQTLAGPAVIAHVHVPDLNATIGNNGGLCMPLFRDSAASIPNLTPGLLETVSATLDVEIDAERFAAYLFGILGTEAYTAAYADEVASAGIRVPITADAGLFSQVADLGAELLWWATFAERFQPTDTNGKPIKKLPYGTATNTVPVPATAADYPRAFSYDPATQRLTVGGGVFERVTPEVWEFEVSGFKVVQSWLGYRMRKRAGKTSSELDKLRPGKWSYSQEFLELLAVVERFVARQSDAAGLLTKVVSGSLVTSAVLPEPTKESKATPKPIATPGATLFS